VQDSVDQARKIARLANVVGGETCFDWTVLQVVSQNQDNGQTLVDPVWPVALLGPSRIKEKDSSFVSARNLPTQNSQSEYTTSEAMAR
jgi:hypothetical protein